MADIFANIVVALVVLWSTVVALRKFIPQRMYSAQLALSQGLANKGWLRLSRWCMPTSSASSCGGCNSCGDESTGQCATPTVAEKDQQKPVQWR